MDESIHPIGPGSAPRVETRQVDTTVVAVIHKYHQAELQAADGFRYALTERTPGIHLSALREGQHFRCTVTVRYPRVLRAELLPG